MQDAENTHQEPGSVVELPPGVFPPLPGYATADLLAVANASVERLLEEHAIDPALIRESVIALAQHLYAAFEREDVQSQIASWYQKPYDQVWMRKRSVQIIAEQFGIVAQTAMAAALQGSPLRRLGKVFYLSVVESAGNAVESHILKLNED
ncbi:hypothetical protein [Pseudomonas sp. BP8]|uniref:hypothetical protein n=1 Tax=Pseudomonas sp. BP8 TaxID=2817864 RepID=UPI001AEB9709|nr:hypothetical protein [Pseudomonas sp. BP8]MBP2260278.1 hypothetical protein [Pseudomonas sp. BP8]HDS1733918.1 hypothetical protein [Pseudomonas putida]